MSRQPENRWTPEEDQILIAAIEQCGPIIVWSEVSVYLPHRNNKSCRKRWIHSLDPALRKGRWTGEEDDTLISAVQTYGAHWFQVAKLLPGRTDDQCAKRWRENLDPSISRTPWSKEEDELLMRTFEKLGRRWKDIASSFKGRPPVHCRNRVQSLVRAKRRAAKVKAVGISKCKSRRPAYDPLITASSSPAPNPASPSAARAGQPLSNTDNATDPFNPGSVSSVASGELSTFLVTPLPPSQDTLPATGPVGIYTPTQKWNLVPLDQVQLGMPREKSINSTTFDPDILQSLATWDTSADVHLPAPSHPSVTLGDDRHHSDFQPFSRYYTPYYSHSRQSILHPHQYQQPLYYQESAALQGSRLYASF